MHANVDAVVNAVNTKGIMGKGIALQFRRAYPDNYEAYRKACAAGEVQPGRKFIFDRETPANPRYIINFPTKRDWRRQSQIVDTETGLEALVKDVLRTSIRSVAVPALGCGNGGLLWPDVLQRIRTAFELAPEVRWTRMQEWLQSSSCLTPSLVPA